MMNSEPRRLLSSGVRGNIQAIDADGDFHLKCESGESAWIFRARSTLLLKLVGMSTIAHEFERIQADVHEWEIQAMEK